ncbi:MAG: hypothetical protein ABIR30_06910 [Chitinophagaceae bacterium]
MRYIYTLLFTAITISSSAQFSINMGYSLGAPQQKMAENIKPVHSITAGAMYNLPGALNRIQVGTDISWGMYANTRKMQTFNFGNGSSTETWVNYSSNVIQGNLVSKVFFLKDKNIMPYASGKVGYTSFYSNIYIEDPDDPDGCKALDQRNLIKDGTISTGYGGGLQVSWNMFGCKKSRDRKDGYIDLSVNNIRGGNLDYINTKKLIDANDPPPSSEGKPLNVRFINATTQEIHEHQVAEVYTTPLRSLEFKLTAVFVLPNKRG